MFLCVFGFRVPLVVALVGETTASQQFANALFELNKKKRVCIVCRFLFYFILFSFVC
jgi:hypothetical protein